MRRTAGLIALSMLVASVFGLVACGNEKRAEAAPLPKTVNDFFSIKVGTKTVRMQLAITQPEQERGLMERRDLGRDDGMLFVYAKPQQMHFWMHDTPTALDIGFFDSNGVLVEIYPMQPFDESTISSRSDSIQFPLEMNQGWFSTNDVRVGSQIDLSAVSNALSARGFDPKQYGLPTGKNP